MENWNLQWPLLLFSTTQPTASSPVTRSLYQYMYGYWDFFLFFPCIWFGILELFLKGFCNGLSSSRPNYSWMRGSGNNIRPIKAAVEMPPFPLFEPPQIESDTPSQVCAMPIILLLSLFVFPSIVILCYAWFLWEFWENDKIWNSVSRVFLCLGPETAQYDCWVKPKGIQKFVFVFVFCFQSNQTICLSVLEIALWRHWFLFFFNLLLFLFLRLSTVGACRPWFLQDRVCSECSSIRCWIQGRAWWIWSLCL